MNMNMNVSINTTSSPYTSTAPANSEKAQEQAIASIRKLNDITSTEEVIKLERQGGKVTIGEEALVKVIEKANKAIAGVSTSLEFSVHEKTNSIMVKVLDKETGEIIREIPPEKTLDLVAKLWELAGILVDERR